ncbi:MAG: zinc ribbon domain-containing protein [Atopobiaceae bacterium]|nr:zinc ribbon domain-containing protein [Atopobiaceae bacterium]
MICPSCNSNIPDGSRICPACRATLSISIGVRSQEYSYCPGCGALVPGDADACPVCGMPVDRGEAPEPREREVSELDSTQSFARIESALPELREREEEIIVRPGNPQGSRSLIIAALAALIVVSSIVLIICHPWDPDAYSIRATTPADTSYAGFPGTIDSLSGQDSKHEQTDVVSGDDATFQLLHDAWADLGDIASRLDANEELFWEIGFGGDREERAAAREQADAYAIELSNLIEDIRQADVTSGTYTEERERLLTLGNWLRNRSDALSEAWALDMRMEDEGLTREKVASPLLSEADADGRNTYGNMFDEAYESAEPQKR